MRLSIVVAVCAVAAVATPAFAATNGSYFGFDKSSVKVKGTKATFALDCGPPAFVEPVSPRSAKISGNTLTFTGIVKGPKGDASGTVIRRRVTLRGTFSGRKLRLKSTKALGFGGCRGRYDATLTRR